MDLWLPGISYSCASSGSIQISDAILFNPQFSVLTLRNTGNCRPGRCLRLLTERRGGPELDGSQNSLIPYDIGLDIFYTTGICIVHQCRIWDPWLDLFTPCLQR